MGFFRYPGGKSKLRNEIISRINYNSYGLDLEYREPFFGGGSIGSSFIQEIFSLKKVWINDIDPGIASLWTSLIKYPDLLKIRIIKFKPSVEAFNQFRKELTGPVPKLDNAIAITDYGFKKLAVHQISYSGLGTKSGGPLGGQNQNSQYKIDCRWSPQYICKKIDKLTDLFSRISIRNNGCTSLDFADIINDNEYDAIIYLDPPYFIKGNDLYQYGFNESDHIRLADCLRQTKHRWVLSYDNCPEIIDLYNGWSDIKRLSVNYTITSSRIKSELLITSNSEIENVLSTDFCESAAYIS